METEKAPHQSPHFPDSFYRVSVKGLVVQDGKLLMGYDTTCMINGEVVSRWELPGGGMEFGEDLHDAVKREVQEELGVKVTWIAEKPMYIWTYKKEGSRGLPWYHILLLAYPVKLESLKITPTDECTEIKFFSKEELQTLEINDQIEPLRQIFNPDDFK